MIMMVSQEYEVIAFSLSRELIPWQRSIVRLNPRLFVDHVDIFVIVIKIEDRINLMR